MDAIIGKFTYIGTFLAFILGALVLPFLEDVILITSVASMPETLLIRCFHCW